jgi:hypothetical protein
VSRRASLVLFGPAVAWLFVVIAGVSWTVASGSKWGEVDRASASVVGSDDCRRCHPAQWSTWHASFHRTMTQEAHGEAVLAPFAGESLSVLGFVAVMDRDGGAPRVTIRREDGSVLLQAEVELTVGSHRYQQYVARIDRGGGSLERWRLPVAWHVAEARWIHLGGAFLFPDGEPGSEEDLLRHLSRWNDNCVFCHNTQPVPGLRKDGTFATTVGELGIACEACHGGASLHASRMADPFRRVLAGVGRERGDTAIGHPGTMTAAREVDVCGRCHGNRIGHDLGEVLARGDGFVPGEALSEVSRPIFADSRLASDPVGARPFAERFWPDGTPRLSAYEHQALLLSPCAEEMRCGDCHAMHGEHPDMQLREDWSPVDTCRRCHEGVAVEHGGHETVDCVGCHMPRVTYGLLEGMMSHRVTSPDPGALVGRMDQPDACTQCHVDRSRSWAADAMVGLGLGGTISHHPSPAVGSQVELDLLGGDPVQRALAAHALSRTEAVGDRSRRLSALALALEDDYPAVRWFAWRAYRALAREDPAIALYDFMADPANRLYAIDALNVERHPLADRLPELEAGRDDRAIEIGE